MNSLVDLQPRSALYSTDKRESGHPKYVPLSGIEEIGSEVSVSDTIFDIHAPFEEQLLLTSSMRDLLGFGNLLFQQEKPYTTIGLVTGGPGTGKSCAARALQQQLQSA